MMLYQSRNVLCSDLLSFGETSSLFTSSFVSTVAFDTMSDGTRLSQHNTTRSMA